MMYHTDIDTNLIRNERACDERRTCGRDGSWKMVPHGRGGVGTFNGNAPTVSPASASMTSLAEATRFTAAVRDQNGQVMAGAAVAWASSNASVASVVASGQVTAAANGECNDHRHGGLGIWNSGSDGRAGSLGAWGLPGRVRCRPSLFRLTKFASSGGTGLSYRNRLLIKYLCNG